MEVRWVSHGRQVLHGRCLAVEERVQGQAVLVILMWPTAGFIPSVSIIKSWGPSLPVKGSLP